MPHKGILVIAALAVLLPVAATEARVMTCGPFTPPTMP
jgi:hypothetical protein